MTTTTSTDRPDSRPRPGPVARLFGLFDSVTLGIVLLSILFVYCTIGSAGILYPIHPNLLDTDSWVHAQMRQWRPFEMTEFEWFHWWPFDLLIGLICLNIVTVTIKRIRLNAINLGVWLIHTGILVLCLGSFIYFSTKVEGDAPVLRRQVAIQLPGGEQATLSAIPGNSTVVGTGDDAWHFQIWSCDPEWEILSGTDQGKQTFGVQVAVSGGGQEFIRQLLAGYPEYTEDVVPGGEEGQPMARAVKVLGKPLVDEALQLSLEYQPQTHFYLANWVSKAWALYLREVQPDGTTTPWVERPIDDMPLYNDYVRSLEEVWPPEGETLQPDPLDVLVEATAPDDPLPGVPVAVTSYLRYAQLSTRQVSGGDELAPVVTLRLDDGRGRVIDQELAAFDPARATAQGGFLGLEWAASAEQQASAGSSRPHTLLFRVPGSDVEHEHVVSEVSWNDRELPWLPLPGSDYEYRVEFVEDLRGQGGSDQMASVELRTPERSYRRWLFEDPGRTHDVSPWTPEEPEAEHDHSDPDHVHEPPKSRLIPDEVFPTDEGIAIVFRPGNDAAPLTVVAGPGDDDLGIVFNLGSPDDGTYLPVAVGERVSLGRGESLVVTSLVTHSSTQTRPWVVPQHLRNRDVKEGNAMVRLQLVHGGKTHEPWVLFHQYPFEQPNDTLRRHRYRPERVALADGRQIELILSRQRRELPAPVVLEDFVVTPHVGGFTGQIASILNWTSQVRFADEHGEWSPPQPVSVNAPAEDHGLWYFQAQWDPPMGPRFRGDPSSAGLNYTVLGIGNRHGVGIQLGGCMISVLGMLYAFYVKPQLRRRKSAQAALVATGAPRAVAAGTSKRRSKKRTKTPLPTLSTLSEDKA